MTEHREYITIANASDSLLGCHIWVRNFILGGWSGYSSGKLSLALKKPPSLNARRSDTIHRATWHAYELEGIRRAAS